MGKLFQWQVAEKISEAELLRFPEFSELVIQLLANRGITETADIESFLQPDYFQDQHDPFLFRDMRVAVDRINQALKNKEKITIHGDYDADGICSTSILYYMLKKMAVKVKQQQSLLK